MTLLRWALPLAVALTAVAAGPAAAEDPVTSANVKFEKNVPYPVRGEGGAQAGTDLEFATITVAAPAAVAAPSTPAATKTPVKPIAAKTKANAKKYAACAKKAKKIKSKRKRGKALKACAKRFKSAKAKMALADVDAELPGVQRTYSFAGSYDNGLQIIDVSDPVNPERVATYDCAITQGDPQVFQRPDLGGRWFVTYTSDGGASDLDSACVKDADAAGSDASGRNGSGTYIIEVTNPAAPKAVSFAYFAKGSHNQSVHPSGKFLYNSNSDLVTDVMPGIEVVDIADITKPKDVMTLPMVPLPGLGSNAHDISFSADGKRAYAAAITQSVIINTENPASPTVISRIPNEYNVSHQAETIEASIPGLGERTVLIVSDEFDGAVGTGECPSGGLHVYDVSPDVEAAPIRLGYFNLSEVRTTTDDQVGNCTSHVYQLHRKENLMVIGWYNAGFRVLDVSALAGVSFGAQGTGIKELAFGRFPAGTVWAAKTPYVNRKGSFPVFSNDEKRGFDAWTVDLSKPARRRGSVIRFTPAALEVPRARPSLGTAAFVCRLGARDL
jgi:hypothetical protein